MEGRDPRRGARDSMRRRPLVRRSRVASSQVPACPRARREWRVGRSLAKSSIALRCASRPMRMRKAGSSRRARKVSISLVGTLEQEAVASVTDVSRIPATRFGHDRETAQHRLEHDAPEGLEVVGMGAVVERVERPEKLLGRHRSRRQQFDVGTAADAVSQRGATHHAHAHPVVRERAQEARLVGMMLARVCRATGVPPRTCRRRVERRAMRRRARSASARPGSRARCRRAVRPSHAPIRPGSASVASRKACDV